MSMNRTDEIAREAARLIQIGRGGDIAAAIHKAAVSLGLLGVSLPSVERVRKHAQAMAMQSMGEAEYESRRRQMLENAEQLMTALEFALPDSQTRLVGRAAEGHLDAGVAVHIRLYTAEAMSAIIDQLTQLGYEEIAFRTAETRHGRLNQFVLNDDGFEIVLTRCPNRSEFDDPLDLFSGHAVKSMSVTQLRRSIHDHNRRMS